MDTGAVRPGRRALRLVRAPPLCEKLFNKRSWGNLSVHLSSDLFILGVQG